MRLDELSVTNLEERASELERLQLKNYSKQRNLDINELMKELKRRQKNGKNIM